MRPPESSGPISPLVVALLRIASGLLLAGMAMMLLTPRHEEESPAKLHFAAREYYDR